MLLKIGIQNADEGQWKSVEAVSALLDGAGIKYRNTRDIETEIWVFRFLFRKKCIKG